MTIQTIFRANIRGDGSSRLCITRRCELMRWWLIAHSNNCGRLHGQLCQRAMNLVVPARAADVVRRIPNHGGTGE